MIEHVSCPRVLNRDDIVIHDGLLTLVNATLTLRAEERTAVPAAALQLSQSGTFVFVVENDAASVRPVTVERTVDGLSVIASGLDEGEIVVTDGQLQLSNGAKVTVRGKTES